MPEPKFTPGPWRVTQPWNGFANLEAPQEGRVIFALAGAQPPAHAEEQQANAHLLAASPDLYAALENTLAQLMQATKLLDSECTNEMAEAWRNGVSALRKARGAS